MERVRPGDNLDGRQLRRDRQGVRSAALTQSPGQLTRAFALQRS